jgi:hypothetical protein
MSIFTKAFWRAAAERASKAFAYSASAALIAQGTGIIEANWRDCLSVAGMALVLSVLGSIASDAATDGPGPSLTNAEVLTDAPPPGEGGQASWFPVAVVVLLLLILLVLAGVLNVR